MSEQSERRELFEGKLRQLEQRLLKIRRDRLRVVSAQLRDLKDQRDQLDDAIVLVQREEDALTKAVRGE